MQPIPFHHHHRPSSSSTYTSFSVIQPVNPSPLVFLEFGEHRFTSSISGGRFLPKDLTTLEGLNASYVTKDCLTSVVGEQSRLEE